VNFGGFQENKQLHGYNHIDFAWGQKAAVDIYLPIVKSIQKDQL
jgi:hypothetical protein